MQHGSQENIANESIQHPDTSDDTSDDTSTTRDLGNKAYRNGHIQEALDHWNRGIRSCQYILAKDVYVDAEKKKVETILVLLYSNVAAAHLKNHAYHLCVECCHNALKYDPFNEKCLYRKAKALLYLSRYEDALIEINKLVSLDSNNIPARQLKKNIIQLGKAARVKEQQMMKHLFSLMSATSVNEPHGFTIIKLLHGIHTKINKTKTAISDFFFAQKDNIITRIKAFANNCIKKFSHFANCFPKHH